MKIGFNVLRDRNDVGKENAFTDGDSEHIFDFGPFGIAMGIRKDEMMVPYWRRI